MKRRPCPHLIGVREMLMNIKVLNSCRLFTCVRCGSQVLLCSSCDHGNIYCDETCSSEARKHHHREANRRYGKSRKGRFSSASRSRTYRENQRVKNNVTDQGSSPRGVDVPLIREPEPTFVAEPMLLEVQESDTGEIRIKVSAPVLFCARCKAQLNDWVRVGYLRCPIWMTKPWSSCTTYCIKYSGYLSVTTRGNPTMVSVLGRWQSK